MPFIIYTPFIQKVDMAAMVLACITMVVDINMATEERVINTINMGTITMDRGIIIINTITMGIIVIDIVVIEEEATIEVGMAEVGAAGGALMDIGVWD